LCKYFAQVFPEGLAVPLAAKLTVILPAVHHPNPMAGVSPALYNSTPVELEGGQPFLIGDAELPKGYNP
jgi:hypothetical protein